jgi:UDP:flavonoid glycosyltransferase YjiC (YdhE family)
MFQGTWRACTEACDEHDVEEGVDPQQARPFVADAIISNPPTYASLHIAERLAVPLHYMFTMPWSPTTAFPHPLAQMDSSRTDAGRRNYLSYTQIEVLTWLGLTDIINRFRRRTLLLEPIDPTWGTNLVERLKVPYTYCWSPALIPKPADWGAHIGVSGFFFLPSATDYKPDPKLQAFLDAGEPPVYIGFGSIVIDDPDGFTKLILEAVQKAGVRALVSKGWSNVGGSDVPDNVYLLGNVPHDWLFQHVSAVVHHGGAGTCAIGLALGKPTVIVPFFGDQFWWAGIVYRAGAGPQAVPYKKLTADNLADNIKYALKPETQAKAQELSEKMKGEDGVAVAAEQFHNLQSAQNFACFLCPDRTAVWRVRRTNVQLSAIAVAVLCKYGRLKPRNIKLWVQWKNDMLISKLTVRRIRHRRWYVEEGAPGPVSGAVASIADTIANCVSDVQDCKRRIRRSKHARAQTEQNEKAVPMSNEKPQSTGGAIAQLSQELAVEAVTGKSSPQFRTYHFKC